MPFLLMAAPPSPQQPQAQRPNRRSTRLLLKKSKSVRGLSSSGHYKNLKQSKRDKEPKRDKENSESPGKTKTSPVRLRRDESSRSLGKKLRKRKENSRSPSVLKRKESIKSPGRSSKSQGRKTRSTRKRNENSRSPSTLRRNKSTESLGRKTQLKRNGNSKSPIRNSTIKRNNSIELQGRNKSPITMKRNKSTQSLRQKRNESSGSLGEKMHGSLHCSSSFRRASTKNLEDEEGNNRNAKWDNDQEYSGELRRSLGIKKAPGPLKRRSSIGGVSTSYGGESGLLDGEYKSQALRRRGRRQ
jgi:hypothetical protein